MNMSDVEKFDPETRMFSEIDSLKKAYDDYKRLYDLSTVFYESHDISVVLDRVLDAFREIVDFSGSALYLIESPLKNFYLYEGRNLSAESTYKVRQLEKDGYLEWALKIDRIILIPSEIPESRESTLFIPLVINGTALGVLVILIKSGENQITTRLMDQFVLLSTQAAMAIKNAKLYQDLERKNQTISEIRNFLTSVLSSMADPLIAFDGERKIVLFNPAAEELFQIPALEVLHHQYVEVLPESLLAIFDQANQLAQHGENLQKDGILFQRDGVTIPLGIHTSSIKSHSDGFNGVIISIRDLSETRELMNLREIDQLKDEFISSISHELRTPLTAIQSFTEILLDYENNDPETQKEFLKIIQSQSYRLLDIINNMLMVAEINRDELRVSESSVILVDLVEEIVSLFRERSKEKNLNFKISISSDLVNVTTDSRYLKQILVNLIDNAIKFNSDGGLVEIGALETSDKRIQIFVRDSGIGIPAEGAQLIFHRFKQLGNTLTNKPDGVGLGLFIAKKLIEKMKGEIWVESQEGDGATFYILFPAGKIEEKVKDGSRVN